MKKMRLPAVGPSMIQRILLCDLCDRDQVGLRARSSSLPGHLIQLTTQGTTIHQANGRRYTLGPGSLIWYHEDETVHIEVLKAPWHFYTLNFIAPTLSPPPFEARVRKVGSEVANGFSHLLKAWRKTSVEPAFREFKVQARLLDLLAIIAGGQPQAFASDPLAQLWWELETRLRQDLAKPINLTRMVKLTGKSQATLARSYLAATKLAPMKRIKQIRLSMARGLVVYSELSFKEIANRIGYERSNEFSRDYRLHFAHSPTHDRTGQLSSQGST